MSGFLHNLRVCLVKAMVFPMVIDGYESWTVKKAEHLRIDAFEQWCWRRLLRVPWTARRSNQSVLQEISPIYLLEGLVLKKTLESPLDSKEIQPVHPKGNQSWILIGRTNVEAETPVLWPSDAKNWLIWKDPDARKDWGQEEKGTAEDEMVGWHHQLNGHGFGWTLGVGDGQGSLACCSSWGHKELDTTEQLNWTELNSLLYDPTLTSIHDQWKNHSFDYMGICQWSDSSSF